MTQPTSARAGYLIGMGLLGSLGLIACGTPSGLSTPETGTPASTPTASAEETESPTPSQTPTALRTPTPTATATQTTTATPTATQTATATPTALPDQSYSATIRYTEGGVPHILAETLGSAGYGHGYSFAKQNVCILAEQVMKVRSERSRYLGAGENGEHLDWDFAMLHLGIYRDAEVHWPSLSDDAKEIIRGFVAGYNRYIRETPSTTLPAPCRAAPWVREITPIDLTAYYVNMALMGSGQALVPGIARAFPPADDPTGPEAPLAPPKTADLRLTDIGSNGWAFGAEDSENGRGLLLANPHFPWEGELRFSEVHMRVPGKMDMYGAALMGSAIPNIGFNPGVAWTHTFSWASRMTFYRLSLDPRDPTRYRYDGRMRDMEASTYTLQVLGEDGALSTERRTLYHSHWGPLVSTEEFGWTGLTAITFRDINKGNPYLFDHFLQMGLAEDMDAFKAVHEEVRGIPWVYTMATDTEGEAYFVDSSLVPNLSEDSIAEWQESLEAGDPLTVLASTLGVPLLEGTTSANEWIEDPSQPRPGAIPFDEAPQMSRQDYVFNSNDSHWLANPSAPLEGYSPLYGPERTPRRPRTRMNLRLLTEEGPQSYRGEDGKFSVEELAEMTYANRAIMVELLRADVLERCFAQTSVIVGPQRVDITPTCEAIESWDGRLNMESQGAAAWREFTGYFGENGLKDAGDVFLVPFDPDSPLDTPRDLAPAPEQGQDPILQALGTSQLNLEGAGFSPDVPLGDIQYTLKGDERIGLHGGQEHEGPFNMAYYSGSFTTHTSILPKMPTEEAISSETDLSTEGYPVNYGSSYILLMNFTDDGPKGQVTLSYSQSGDPASPNFADQTRDYAAKQWRDIRFSEEEILASPALEVVELTTE